MTYQYIGVSKKCPPGFTPGTLEATLNLDSPLALFIDQLPDNLEEMKQATLLLVKWGDRFSLKKTFQTLWVLELPPTMEPELTAISKTFLDLMSTQTPEQANDCLDVSHTWMWKWRIEQNSVLINNTWAKKLHLELPGKEKLTFDQWLGSLNPEDIPEVQKVLESHLNGQNEYCQVEYRLRHEDGHWVWIHFRGNIAEQSDAGKPLVMIGTHAHVSEQKSVEIQTLRSRDMLRLILNTIPARVFWKDRNSIYLGCNQLFAEDARLGHPDQVVGKNDYEIGFTRDAEYFRADDRLVMDSGEPKLNFEEPQTAPDGKTIILKTSKIPLRDGAGTIWGVLGTYEDITEMKRATEQIEKDLEEKKVLLQEVHHRVKNNLSVIISLLNLQSRSITTPENALSGLEESKNRIFSMAQVHEMLYRADSFSEINMKPYVETMVAQLKSLYGTEQHVDVELLITDASMDVNHAIPCGLILNELITNVFKHAFNGRDGGKLSISIIRLDNDYQIRVADNGVGMSDKARRNLKSTLGMHLDQRQLKFPSNDSYFSRFI